MTQFWLIRRPLKELTRATEAVTQPATWFALIHPTGRAARAVSAREGTTTLRNGACKRRCLFGTFSVGFFCRVQILFQFQSFYFFLSKLIFGLGPVCSWPLKRHFSISIDNNRYFFFEPSSCFCFCISFRYFQRKDYSSFGHIWSENRR